MQHKNRQYFQAQLIEILGHVVVHFELSVSSRITFWMVKILQQQISSCQNSVVITVPHLF